MAIKDRNTLKNWFKTGLKPLQSQFWDWLDSFVHKDDNISSDKIAWNGNVTGNWDEAYVHAQSPHAPVNAIEQTEKGAANGVATLGADAKIPTNQIPSLAINDYIISSENTLAAYISNEWTDGSIQIGDMVEVTDTDSSQHIYVLYQNNGNAVGDYKEVNLSKIDWSNLLNKPTSSVADLDTAVTHSQTTGNPHATKFEDLEATPGETASESNPSNNNGAAANDEYIWQEFEADKNGNLTEISVWAGSAGASPPDSFNIYIKTGDSAANDWQGGSVIATEAVSWDNDFSGMSGHGKKTIAISETPALNAGQLYCIYIEAAGTANLGWDGMTSDTYTKGVGKTVSGYESIQDYAFEAIIQLHAPYTTDDIVEGDNKYYTDARAIDAIDNDSNHSSNAAHDYTDLANKPTKLTDIESTIFGKVAWSSTNIDWSDMRVRLKTLSANETWTFSNLQAGKTISVYISGDYAITLPGSVTTIDGTYDGTTNNIIIFHCIDDTSGSEVVVCQIYTL